MVTKSYHQKCQSVLHVVPGRLMGSLKLFRQITYTFMTLRLNRFRPA
jgi:hypothetical protein